MVSEVPETLALYCPKCNVQVDTDVVGEYSAPMAGEYAIDDLGPCPGWLASGSVDNGGRSEQTIWGEIHNGRKDFHGLCRKLASSMEYFMLVHAQVPCAPLNELY